MAFLSALLAEAVEVDEVGRTTIRNVFEVINLPDLPVVFGPMVISLRLDLEGKVLPPSLMAIVSLAFEGGPFLKMEQLVLTVPEGEIEMPYVNLELRIAGLFISNFGKHRVRVEVPEFGSVEIPLIVKLIAAQ